jgi:esterase/lipase
MGLPLSVRRPVSLASLMTPLGYDCLAPSLPAHDSSPDQPLRVGRQSLRDYLAFLEQMVATREDRRPPIIIGYSMGGLLAQQLAARVQPLALVLLAPAAPYGITSISLTNTGAFLHYVRNGAFWRNGYKPDFARAALRLSGRAILSSPLTVRRIGSRIRPCDFRNRLMAARLLAVPRWSTPNG